MVRGGSALRDGIDAVGHGHRGRGHEANGGAGLRALHLAVARHRVGILACRLRVEATPRLRVPPRSSIHRLHVGHAAEAAHGLVAELLHLCSLQDPGEDCAEEDANHDGAAHAQEDQQAHEAKEPNPDPSSQVVLAREGDEIHQHCRMVPDDVDAVASLQADEGQEQADPCHGGFHHPGREDLEDIAPDIQSGHDDEDHALHGHRHHHLLHGILLALEPHDRVGEVGVHAHARPEPEGQVGPEGHDERGDAAGGRRGEDEAIEVEARGAQDVGVHGHDVGRREEGGDPGPDLRGEVRAALGDPEVVVHPGAPELPVQRVVHQVLLPLGTHLELDLRHGV